ncbi:MULTISPECIES: hypothetical protein [Bacillus]|uniref:Uncharacterized protein n=1 Tax=Bacillus glycinifermentans TaxID=1664069 RepID=A0A0T6BI86_9BACI|nr:MULTISPECIES: hypothetical protein [Bacillus]KRT87062.1 hypothetical protein AB447_208835 [Bacillus glycinifermentans]MEC0487113.1 hypothetical protein [Bacillus glycinifermentans]UBF35378.1 hypothetical protein K9N56_23835 [Bacillus sp. PM8313]
MEKKMTFEKQIKVRALLKENVYYSLKDKPRGFNKRVNDLVELMENLTDGEIEWSEIKHLDSLEELVLYFNKKGLLDVSALQQPALNSIRPRSDLYYENNIPENQNISPVISKTNHEISLQEYPKVAEPKNNDGKTPIATKSNVDQAENTIEQSENNSSKAQHTYGETTTQSKPERKDEITSQTTESKQNSNTKSDKSVNKQTMSEEEKKRKQLGKMKKMFM